MTTNFTIISLNIGKAVPFRADGTLSAIAKAPVSEPQMLTAMGFADDEVADPLHHGGVDKAVHLYDQDHYPWWRERLGDHPLLQQPNAFGENIATQGLTEDVTHIGDRFRIGEALIEISHGRQPCWKLDHRFQRKGRDSIMAAIVNSGRCGLYARVIEEGHVAPDDALMRVERGDIAWSIRRVFALLIAGDHKQEPDAIEALAHHPKLADAWRLRAQKLLGQL
ncbi:MAG: MOSC domain-containing protein [Pseudomonadota bacterium]